MTRPSLRLVDGNTDRPTRPPLDLNKALAELADYLCENHTPAPRLHLIRSDNPPERTSS